MKKSSTIRMAILASVCVVALAACDDKDDEQTRDANTYQKQYASVEECMQDWDDASQCESVPVVQNGVTIYMYNGPRFYWTSYNGVPRAMTITGRPMRATSSLTIANSGVARGSVSVSARTGAVSTGSSAARGGFGSSASAGGHAGGGGGGEGAGG